MMKKFVAVISFLQLFLVACGGDEIPVLSSPVKGVSEESINKETETEITEKTVSEAVTSSASATESYSETIISEIISEFTSAAEMQIPEETSQVMELTETESESSESETAETYEYIAEETTEKEIAEGISFKVTEAGIDIFNNGELVQTVAGNYLEEFSQYGDSPESHIIYEDFNFDGINDIFIPDILGTVNISGKYFQYDSDTEMFVPWDQLNNKVGQLVNIIPDSEYLSVHIRLNVVEYEDWLYKWDNDILKPLSLAKQFIFIENIYMNTYQYDENGEKIFIVTDKMDYDENGNLISSTKVEPIYEE